MKKLAKKILGVILVLSIVSSFFTTGFATIASAEPGPGETANVKFGVISDVHLTDDTTYVYNEEVNLTNMLTKFKAENINVLMVAGDFTNKAETGGYQKFINIFNTVFDNPATRPQKVFAMGNHDFGSLLPSTAKTRFQTTLGVTANSRTVVNGYNFINLSPDNSTSNGSFSATTRSWLTTQLNAAVAADPNKPIFVTFHQPCYNTVYGSIAWGNSDLYQVLQNYPQVVAFSGHSHFVLEDERSIHQRDFTSVGTSTLSYVELESGKENGSIPPRASEIAQGIIGTVTNTGIHMKRWDVHSNVQIKNDWVVNLPLTKPTFQYTESRANSSVAPVFPSGSAITVSNQTSTSATFTVPQATHNDFVHSYRVKVTNSATNAVVADKLWFSDFYLGLHRRSATQSFTVSGLSANTNYTAQVYAIESYGKESAPISTNFNSSSAAGVDILNITMENQTPQDRSTYNTTYQLKNSPSIVLDTSINKYVVALNGTNYINYAVNSTQISNLTNQFTIEAAFKMNSLREQAIFENCQAGGIGLESTATGLTEIWAYIGGSYKRVGVQLQAGVYYHLLATYNGNEIRLYLNGNLVNSLATTGTVTHNSATPFCLGGDPDTNGNAYIPFDGNIALARIYSVGISATEAKYRSDDFFDTGTDILNVNFNNQSLADSSSFASINTPVGTTNIAMDSQISRNVASFSGSNHINYTLSNRQRDLISKQFTIEAYFKFNTLKAQAIVENTQSSGIGFESNATGYTDVWAYIGGSYKTLGVQLQAGVYYHLVATYDGTQIKLYLNGQLANTLANVTGVVTHSVDMPMCIGGDPNYDGSASLPLDGKIGKIRVSSKSISAADVLARYNSL